eukprot:CAMPEP_0117014436 /NCGR_PEP_ID=MMETSP0472-20121206/11709_1 /TAXON_ID=693140 ORGANISM="Tiarina fusus, Strain LIS" /NCGR_SAMPLE_ID=MMETSP0472 /ASSEMBLY_ACC=CAM_ASM_000603 /LENGTH=47 /DNA_ID= /DNA_START= /DNA_END= /DNA_ORIENTATION=
MTHQDQQLKKFLHKNLLDVLQEEEVDVVDEEDRVDEAEVAKIFFAFL